MSKAEMRNDLRFCTKFGRNAMLGRWLGLSTEVSGMIKYHQPVTNIYQPTIFFP